MLFTSHEYDVVTIFFQCVSLIELNSWKDEIYVAIKSFTKRRKESKGCNKKRKKEKEVI